MRVKLNARSDNVLLAQEIGIKCGCDDDGYHDVAGVSGEETGAHGDPNQNREQHGNNCLLWGLSDLRKQQC
ncbi:MAG: hypothetical protein IJ274_12850, partial [Lachnospiraceae bacterium]|nr:hypothetical protein [Lachnospiraceae bacterium]